VLTVTAILDQYAFLYSPTTPGANWDHIVPVNGAYAAIKRVDGTDYVMFRGSLTFLDWIEDFDHFALPIIDQILDAVHPGFREGVLEIADPLNDLVGDHVVAVGHSLGAGHAALWAGYRIAAKKPVDGLVMIGEPRPGGAKLSQLLAQTEVQSFRNTDPKGHDLVTDVPPTLAPLLPYQHVKTPLTDVSCPPAAEDLWLAFKYHHFQLYARAFGCAGPAAIALVRAAGILPGQYG
jgi:pimeloyl-ACP methyl ester carboxylesterase